MILTVDLLAEKYKMLPSQVMQQATTFDLYVMDTVNVYKARQESYSQSGAKIATPHLSQEELLAIQERARQNENKH